MSDRASLERQAKKIGHRIARALPKGVGFTLLVFDFGEAGTGNLAYLSNAQRSDMLKAMREFIAKQEAGGVSSVFES